MISFTAPINGQTIQDSVTHQLTEILEDSELAGFAVTLVSKDKVLYQHGFGYADVEAKKPFTTKTVLNIGSITKTFIGVVCMKLVEEGKLGLDDPINSCLPFKVIHPAYPETQITVRQLATHTSGLTDGKDDMMIEYSYLFKGDVNFKEEELPEDYFPYFQMYRENKEMPMDVFLKEIYTEGGKFYERENFSEQAPGTIYQYTNLGATLLALIIERVSGMPFSDYTRKQVLEPLGMGNSYWDLEAVPQEHLAAHYLSNGLKIPPYELITYPDGGLFTCIQDFTPYLMDIIQGLNEEGQLMKPASYKEIMSNQLTEVNFPKGSFDTSKGIMWSVNKEGDNITMNGGDPGVVTYTLFTTAGNIGLAIFLNKSFYGNESLDKAFFKIRGTLFQNTSKLMKASK